MKSKAILVLITIILFLSFIVGIKYYDHLILNDYQKFWESSINGEIYSIDIKRRGVDLRIKNNLSEFIFYPYTNQQLNENHIFDHFAKAGDMVVKAPHSDTIYLHKKGEIYRYTFRKFDKE